MFYDITSLFSKNGMIVKVMVPLHDWGALTFEESPSDMERGWLRIWRMFVRLSLCWKLECLETTSAWKVSSRVQSTKSSCRKQTELPCVKKSSACSLVTVLIGLMTAIQVQIILHLHLNKASSPLIFLTQRLWVRVRSSTCPSFVAVVLPQIWDLLLSVA